jgi:hypothetical protein
MGSNLSRWLHCFPRERLFIGFHEEIRTVPGLFIDRLCAFLGIDPFPAHRHGLFNANINSSARGVAIPPALERFAAERYRGEAEMLAALVGGPAERWLANIEQLLQRAPA